MLVLKQWLNKVSSLPLTWLLLAFPPSFLTGLLTEFLAGLQGAWGPTCDTVGSQQLGESESQTQDPQGKKGLEEAVLVPTLKSCWKNCPH